MAEKKSRKLQIKEEMLKAGKITAIRNTKASGKLVKKGTVYEVPSMDMSTDDALELVLIKKAVIGKHNLEAEKKAEKKK
jgi:hypothetical protein